MQCNNTDREQTHTYTPVFTMFTEDVGMIALLLPPPTSPTKTHKRVANKHKHMYTITKEANEIKVLKLV